MTNLCKNLHGHFKNLYSNSNEDNDDNNNDDDDTADNNTDSDNINNVYESYLLGVQVVLDYKFWLT